MPNPAQDVRFAILADGLSRREADEQALIISSAGILARVGQEVPFGPHGRSTRARWVVEVDAAHLDQARRVIDTHDDDLPATPRPQTPALGRGAGAHWVIGLILLNGLVWYAMQTHGGSETRSTLLRFGASMTELIAGGDWWRTISAVFLHIGARHLLGNSILLLVLGLICLQEWGPGRLLFIYLLSGVLGNWAGFAFGSAVALKAGASGAILGLLGGLAGSRVRQMRRDRGQPSRFKIWHVLAMLVAFYGFVVGVRPSSDHVAHVGGILAGIGIALLWPYPGSLTPGRERRLQLALGGIAVALAGVGGLLTWAET